MNRTLTRLIQGSVVGLLLVPTAYAHSFLSDYPELKNTLVMAPIISDEHLGEMRGRFVDGNKILYFGVEMVSYWQNQNGSLKSGVGFSADFHSPGQPNIQYRPFTQNTQNNGASLGSSDQTITGTGLSNINGVLQSVQTAGSNNTANNNLTIEIGGINGSSPGFSSTFENVPNQPVSTSLLSLAPNGAMSQASNNHQQLLTRLVIPGQGEVLQFIKHTGSFTGSGVGQQIALTSNNNVVQNSMKLNIQMDTQQVLQQSRDQATQFLRSIGKMN